MANVQILLKRGADASIREERGNTPSALAVMRWGLAKDAASRSTLKTIAISLAAAEGLDVTPLRQRDEQPLQSDSDAIRRVQSLLSQLQYEVSVSGTLDETTRSGILSFRRTNPRSASRDDITSELIADLEYAVAPFQMRRSASSDLAVVNTVCQYDLQRRDQRSIEVVGGCSRRATDAVVEGYRGGVEVVLLGVPPGRHRRVVHTLENQSLEGTDYELGKPN
jgi:hypothetical protein